MKIKNLDKQELFQSAVYDLENFVLHSGYNPDLIVGIPTGGKVVVDLMPKITQKANVVFIAQSRGSTALKKRLKLKNILPYLPRFLNNNFRRLESFILESQFEKKKLILNNSIKDCVIDLDINTIAIVSKSKHILVVDDAIDSGRTMVLVVNSIRKFNPSAKIKIAVINTTFKAPLIYPDYCLFTREIVRYPWANDVKKTGEAG